MKKFLNNFFLYAVSSFLVLAAIEVGLLFVPNTYSYKRDYLEEHINDIRILILGSSYLEEGICPDLIGDGCFNLAISGRNIVFDVELARKYFQRMKNLKTVIFPIDYSKFEFGRGRKNPLDSRIDIDLMTATFRCMHYKYMNLHVDNFTYWSEILNSRLNYISRFWQSRDENVECDSLGFVALPLDERPDGWEYRAVPPIVDTSKKIDERTFDLYWPYVRLLAEFSNRSDVTLVLVNIPKYKTYQRDINDVVVKEMDRLILQLQHDYNNVKYWDFTFDNEFVEEDFYDACHLSEIGARKFTAVLKKKLFSADDSNWNQ